MKKKTQQKVIFEKNLIKTLLINDIKPINYTGSLKNQTQNHSKSLQLQAKDSLNLDSDRETEKLFLLITLSTTDSSEIIIYDILKVPNCELSKDFQDLLIYLLPYGVKLSGIMYYYSEEDEEKSMKFEDLKAQYLELINFLQESPETKYINNSHHIALSVLRENSMMAKDKEVKVFIDLNKDNFECFKLKSQKTSSNFNSSSNNSSLNFNILASTSPNKVFSPDKNSIGQGGLGAQGQESKREGVSNKEENQSKNNTINLKLSSKKLSFGGGNKTYIEKFIPNTDKYEQVLIKDLSINLLDDYIIFKLNDFHNIMIMNNKYSILKQAYSKKMKLKINELNYILPEDETTLQEKC